MRFLHCKSQDAYVIHSEAFGVSGVPLEVVEETPEEVSFDIAGILSDRLVDGVDVALDVEDPGFVVHILAGGSHDAVLGDVDRNVVVVLLHEVENLTKTFRVVADP
ncbi:hypothetical protein L596_011711 [Steinernema carpocapsae]|uniref:Uncharacterized protein n=1 Tax=Steinernema carpocapsae TaxID=34508 RepID=A0A4U5NVQ3_STECR|nr:hypothetical protein L596_011711 [Steinernema carpocapsae]